MTSRSIIACSAAAAVQATVYKPSHQQKLLGVAHSSVFRCASNVCIKTSAMLGQSDGSVA